MQYVYPLKRSILAVVAVGLWLLSLGGCPSECTSSADCGKDEICGMRFHYASEADKEPWHRVCEEKNDPPQQGSSIGGYTITKIEAGTAGMTVTVEKDK